MTSLNQMSAPHLSAPDARAQLVSFDLYERYSLAAHFVRALRGASPYTVLDVGGHSEVLWPGFGSLASAFMPDVKTFVIDLRREPGLRTIRSVQRSRFRLRIAASNLFWRRTLSSTYPQPAGRAFCMNCCGWRVAPFC